MQVSADEQEQLVRKFLPRIALFARAYQHWSDSGLSRDDLIQEGVIGLLQAIRSFQPGANNLQTYADKRVRGAMRDALRESDVLPRSVRTRVGQQAVEDYLFVLQAHLQRERDAQQAETVPGSALLADALRQEVLQAITAACEILAPSTQQAVYAYYHEGQTLKAVGQRLGCSESWVSLQLKAALVIVRRAAKAALN